MKIKLSIKPFFRMSEGQFVRTFKAYINGVVDVDDQQLCFLHAAKVKLPYIDFNRDEFSRIVIDSIMQRLQNNVPIRLKVTSKDGDIMQTESYTYTSLLFDCIDAAFDSPTLIASILADILPAVIKLRRAELDEGLVDRSGAPAPKRVLDTIRSTLDHVTRLVESESLGYVNVKKIKVTHLAPGYSWKSWDAFK